MNPFCRLASSLLIVVCLSGGSFLLAADEIPRIDPTGDPLPAGALSRLGTTRFRHTGNQVSLLHFSPDDKTLLSADFNGEPALRLWEVPTGRALWQLPGEYRSAAFSADGKWIYAVRSERARRCEVLDASNGQVESALENEKGYVSLAYCGQRNQLVLGTVGGDLEIWNAKDLTRLRTCEKVFEGSPSVIVISPSGEKIATACGEETAVLESATGKVILRYRLKGDDAVYLDFAPNEKGLWHVSHQRILQAKVEPEGKVQPIFSTEFIRAPYRDPKSDHILFIDQRFLHKIQRLEGWPYVPRDGINLPQGFFPQKMSLSSTGKLLGMAGTRIRLFRTENGEEINPQPDDLWIRYGMAVSPDGNRLASYRSLWNLSAGKLEHTAQQGTYFYFRGETTLAVTHASEGLAVREVPSQKILFSDACASIWLNRAGLAFGIQQAAGNPQEQQIAVWDLLAGKRLAMLEDTTLTRALRGRSPNDSVFPLPDRSGVYFAAETSLERWNWHKFGLHRTDLGENSRFGRCAFSRNGEWIAFAKEAPTSLAIRAMSIANFQSKPLPEWTTKLPPFQKDMIFLDGSKLAVFAEEPTNGGMTLICHCDVLDVRDEAPRWVRAATFSGKPLSKDEAAIFWQAWEASENRLALITAGARGYFDTSLRDGWGTRQLIAPNLQCEARVDEQNTLTLQRLDREALPATYRLPFRPSGLAFTADGKRLIVGQPDGTALVYETPLAK